MIRRKLASLLRFALLAVALALGGCAANNPRDPFEPYNRAVYKFNDTVDRYAVKPVAEGYRFVVPGLVRTGVRNFFANLEDVWIGTNNLLQGKVGDWANDWMRVAVNTVFGLGGIFDVASEAQMDKHNEDFGQTLGRWGVPAGPYFVVPLLGPRTVRDTFALPLDLYGTQIGRVANIASEQHEVAIRNSLYTLDYIRLRADLLDATNLVEDAALDRYSFTRDAYLQRRLNQVYDGNPPRRKDDDDDDAAAPGAPTLSSATDGKPAEASAPVVRDEAPRVEAIAPAAEGESGERGTTSAGMESMTEREATTAQAAVSDRMR